MAVTLIQRDIPHTDNLVWESQSVVEILIVVGCFSLEPNAHLPLLSDCRIERKDECGRWYFWNKKRRGKNMKKGIFSRFIHYLRESEFSRAKKIEVVEQRKVKGKRSADLVGKCFPCSLCKFAIAGFNLLK